MIDEKKLIDELLNNYLVKNNGTWNDAIDRALELIKSSPKISEWIPCSERLPEADQMVLATEEEGVIFCTYEYFYGYGYGFYPIHGNVTAWMPLPEPYREKVKE